MKRVREKIIYDKKEPLNNDALTSILRGIIAGYLTLAVLLGICAIIVSAGKIESQNMPAAVLVCTLISAAAASVAAAVRYAQKRIFISLAVGGIMFFVSVLVRLLINAGGFPDGWTLFQLISYLAGSILGSAASLAFRRTKRNRR